MVLAVVPVLYACRVVAKSEQREHLASLGQIEALEPCLPEHSARSSNAFSASAEVRRRTRVRVCLSATTCRNRSCSVEIWSLSDAISFSALHISEYAIEHRRYPF